MCILRALKSELLLRSIPGTRIEKSPAYTSHAPKSDCLKVTDSTKTVRTHVGRLYATLVRSDDAITGVVLAH